MIRISRLLDLACDKDRKDQEVSDVGDERCPARRG